MKELVIHKINYPTSLVNIISFPMFKMSIFSYVVNF
jgi:hypothetical protein